MRRYQPNGVAVGNLALVSSGGIAVSKVGKANKRHWNTSFQKSVEHGSCNADLVTFSASTVHTLSVRTELVRCRAQRLVRGQLFERPPLEAVAS